MSEASDAPANQELIAKLHSETALIGWHELQRFFAQGRVLLLSPGLDLVQTAAAMAGDDVASLQVMLDNSDLSPPSPEQARIWYSGQVQLWSVVVAPYVLVQETEQESQP